MTIGRRDAVISALALGASALLPEGTRAASLTRTRSRAAAPGHDAPTQLVALEDYEQAARERLDRVVWEYVDSGAADELTVRWNREAFRAIGLVPRHLRDIDEHRYTPADTFHDSR